MKIIILTPENQEEVLSQAKETLAAGGLVVYPTETCYGLAADATNPQAVQRLLKYKRRREGKPLSILVSSQAVAEKYAQLNLSATNLYKRFLPGPMTVISKSKGTLAPGVASELGTIGIRISSYPLAMALARAYQKPLTATSANASWKKKPYSIADILKPLSANQKELLDLIIDADNLPKREASTVIDTTLVGTMVLRQGDLHHDSDTTSLITHSEEETQKIAQTLLLKHWNELRTQGVLIALIGDLGTGKTVFAKGIGSFLKVQDTITSPSYVLVNEYTYNREGIEGFLYHLDPWRLESSEVLNKLGLSEMVKPDNVVVVEWANKFKEELSQERYPNVKVITVRIEPVNENTRKIYID